jgi:UDP-N-acetylmuramoylalanine--D-glutamate ligase
MRNPELRGDSFLIVGFGREGRSVLEYIRARHPNARIGIADHNIDSTKADIPEGIELFTGPTYLASASSFDTIIRSPGVSIRLIMPSMGENTHLTSATNIFFAECPGRIVGITGTKGKSTTSSLTASILSQIVSDVRLVGNIGTPMLNHLAGATSDTVFVVELSSYQLEDLRRSPHVAILLNIVPEHLDYHGGFDAYSAAKANIGRHQRAGDFLITNETNQLLKNITSGFSGYHLHFNEEGSDFSTTCVDDGTIVMTRNGERRLLMRIEELPVIGPGNLQNALAAITCGVAFGGSVAQIQKGLQSFKPLEHRLEFVATRHKISFYNDSLATIPEALAHALVALGDKVETVIAGGFDRGVDMTPVGPALAGSQVKNLILFPTTGQKIWDAARAAAPQREYIRVDVDSMNAAVQAAYDLTSAGKICVMSPASSSFSVFKDYRDRGEQFREAVRRLSPSSQTDAIRG